MGDGEPSWVLVEEAVHAGYQCTEEASELLRLLGRSGAGSGEFSEAHTCVDKQGELEEALELARQKAKEIDEQVDYLTERAKEVEGEIDEVDQQILDDKEAIRASRMDPGPPLGVWQGAERAKPPEAEWAKPPEDMEAQQQLGYWIEKLKAQDTPETNAIVGQLDAWWIQQIQGDGGSKNKVPKAKEPAGNPGVEGNSETKNRNQNGKERVEEPEQGAEDNSDKAKAEAAALVQGGKAQKVGGKSQSTKPY